MLVASDVRRLLTRMDRTVAYLNVEHYRRLLAAETDESKRKVLQKLLAEEEAKLAEAKEAAARQQKHS